MRKMNLFFLVATTAMTLIAVAANAQGTATTEVFSDGSSIMTSTGTFPVGHALVVGACTPDGSGGFNFDYGDGSASTFDPIAIPSTNLTAQFVACNPLGTGGQDSTGFNTANLTVQVKLTGSVITDVGPNCMTGCVLAPLSGTNPLTGTATVTSDVVFSNCNGQEGIINTVFGIPGNATLTFNSNVDTSGC